jgi:hypothetical protein
VAYHYEHQLALAWMLQEKEEDLSLDHFFGGTDCASALRFLRLTFDRFKSATLPLLPPPVPPLPPFPTTAHRHAGLCTHPDHSRRRRRWWGPGGRAAGAGTGTASAECAGSARGGPPPQGSPGPRRRLVGHLAAPAAQKAAPHPRTYPLPPPNKQRASSWSWSWS